MALPDIDVHLLRCLDVLVTERHVTRAADKLDMSQSSMSTVLARLRRIFDDPILVRTPQGMELSEHAPAIAGAVRRALSELEMAVGHRGRFDPATSSTMFTIMASDYVGLTLVPSLVEKLRVEAPGILLSMTNPDPRRIREVLANSEADLVVGFFPEAAEGLYQTTIATESMSCVVRRPHPVIDGGISLPQYSQGEHVYYGVPNLLVSSLETVLEKLLPQHGIERRTVLHVAALAVLPNVIARTDLIGTLPTTVARLFEAHLPLQVLPVPFPTPPLPIRAIWHERMHENNAHRWLREQVKAAAAGIGAAG